MIDVTAKDLMRRQEKNRNGKGRTIKQGVQNKEDGIFVKAKASFTRSPYYMVIGKEADNGQGYIIQSKDHTQTRTKR